MRGPEPSRRRNYPGVGVELPRTAQLDEEFERWRSHPPWSPRQIALRPCVVSHTKQAIRLEPVHFPTLRPDRGNGGTALRAHLEPPEQTNIQSELESRRRQPYLRCAAQFARNHSERRTRLHGSSPARGRNPVPA